MSMLPADIHKRLDPDLMPVPTHDKHGHPIVIEIDGKRQSRYMLRAAYAEQVQWEFESRARRNLFGLRFGSVLWPSVDTRKDAAVHTLERMGYTYHGGELWKPPLGNAPVPSLYPISIRDDPIVSIPQSRRDDAS